MKCYFQGCDEEGKTKEHIPPRCFFPEGEKEQLLTVKSCELHNNSKAKDDLYVLAQICMNSSPSNRAQEVFLNKVAPQLDFNNGALKKRLAKGSIHNPDGTVSYPVDSSRFDGFFTALSCGIVQKTCGSTLPDRYSIYHAYHNFSQNDDPLMKYVEDQLEQFYDTKPLGFIDFGKPDTRNENIYTVTIYGLTEFKSSITVIHEFFGKFKVTSMLTNKAIFEHS